MSDIIEANNLPAESAPMRMLELAVRSNSPVETLERLMAMHERYEANEARKAYVVAMNAYHAEGIKVFKDKDVDQGTSYKTGKALPKYSHATLANITSTVTPALARHGLSVSWSNTQPGDGFVEVTCTIRHSLGHSESVTLKGPYDVTGGKNDIQAVGSAATYLQRYTLTSILGISALDQDDDGDKGRSTSTAKMVADEDKAAGLVDPEAVEAALSSITDCLLDGEDLPLVKVWRSISTETQTAVWTRLTSQDRRHIKALLGDHKGVEA